MKLLSTAVFFSVFTLNGMEKPEGIQKPENNFITILRLKDSAVQHLSLTPKKRKFSYDNHNPVSNLLRELTRDGDFPSYKFCIKCRKHISNKYIRRHIQLIHLKIHPFTCRYCNKVFQNKQEHSEKLCQYNKIILHS